MVNKRPLILLFILLFFLSIFVPSVSAQDQDVTAEWVWKSTNLYQSNYTTFLIVIKNFSPSPITTHSILIHTAWMNPNIFLVLTYNQTIESRATHAETFTHEVPHNIELGTTSDFAFIVFYKTVDGVSHETGILRAPPVDIKKGKGLYTDQSIPISQLFMLSVFFFGTVVFIWGAREGINTLSKRYTRYLPLFVFLTTFIVYLLALYSNFAPWYINNARLQGFPITGDEPHYIDAIKGLLNGDLNMSRVYPEGVLQHTCVSAGIFNNGTTITAHGLGFPILATIPYVLGMRLIGSGVFGVLIFICALTSGIITLIYKSVTHLLKDVRIGLVTAFSFAFSTLLFPWSGQAFSEIILGFFVMLACYGVLTADSPRDWVITGAVLGYYPFIKNQALVLSIISVVLIIVTLYKRKQNRYLHYFLLSFSIVLVGYVIYVVGFVGLEDTIYVGPGTALVPEETINILGTRISTKFWMGFIGLWLDSNFGLLFHSPILILVFLGIFSFLKSKSERLLVLVSTLTFITWYAGVGHTTYWFGWLSIPGRYMMCIAPLLSLPFAHSIKIYGSNKLFRGSYVGLLLLGFVTNTLLAFNRILGYVVLFVSDIGRTRLMYALSDTFKIDYGNFPDFAYSPWIDTPQPPHLLVVWTAVFIFIVGVLMYIGYNSTVRSVISNDIFIMTDKDTIELGVTAQPRTVIGALQLEENVDA